MRPGIPAFDQRALRLPCSRIPVWVIAAQVASAEIRGGCGEGIIGLAKVNLPRQVRGDFLSQDKEKGSDDSGYKTADGAVRFSGCSARDGSPQPATPEQRHGVHGGGARAIWPGRTSPATLREP
jgi:hypothetical protein